MSALTMYAMYFCKPANAEGGLYIGFRGTGPDLQEGAVRLAKKMAASMHFDPEGRGAVGLPCRYGVDTYTKAFWFYETARGEDQREVIYNALVGPNVLYDNASARESGQAFARQYCSRENAEDVIHGNVGEPDYPRYAHIHGGLIYLMNGPYIMGEIGKAMTPHEAEKIVAELNRLIELAEETR